MNNFVQTLNLCPQKYNVSCYKGRVKQILTEGVILCDLIGNLI